MNGPGVDITDKAVVLRADAHVEGLRTMRDLLFWARGGFGCDPGTMGSAVVGTYLSDGERCRVEGYMVDRLATEQDLAAVAGSPWLAEYRAAQS